MGFRSARKRAGRGLNETAEYIGVSKQAVNLWERGVNEPNIATIKKLADFYGCSIETLLTQDDEEETADAEAETDDAGV